MTSDDLKHLFQAVADQGTETVDLDEHALVPRIRRRRYRRTATACVAGLATAAVIAVSASAVLPGGGERTVASRGGDGPAAVATAPAWPYRCGTAFPAASIIGIRGQKITQKAMTRYPDGWIVDVDAQITNVLPPKTMLRRATPAGKFAVVRDNKVVGQAVLTADVKLKDLAPGQSHTYPALIHIVSCDTAVPPLPVGSYLIYRNVPPGTNIPGVPGESQEVLPSAQLELG